MNVSIIEELITRGNSFTIHLCGHTDPIKIDVRRYKPVVNRKRKSIEFEIPDGLCLRRKFIVDIDSVTHVDMYQYT